jgi:hypothetical protein
MKEMKKTARILATILFLTALCAVVVSAQPPVGGYRSVRAKNKYVGKAAKFAVRAEHNKTGEKLTKLKVIRAWQQVVRGFNFKMCLSVRKNGATKIAEVVVNRFQGEYRLLSWSWNDCR